MTNCESVRACHISNDGPFKLGELSHLPQSVHAARVPTKLIHNIESINPFLRPINPPEPGILGLIPAFPMPKAMVD